MGAGFEAKVPIPLPLERTAPMFLRIPTRPSECIALDYLCCPGSRPTRIVGQCS